MQLRVHTVHVGPGIVNEVGQKAARRRRRYMIIVPEQRIPVLERRTFVCCAKEGRGVDDHDIGISGGNVQKQIAGSGASGLELVPGKRTFAQPAGGYAVGSLVMENGRWRQQENLTDVRSS